jgi:hypothetical protein
MNGPVADAALARPASRANSAAHRFLAVFLVVALLGVSAMAASVAALGRVGLLPAPPLTGTTCFNEKFAFLRTAPLADRTLLAVGSSATWRNLDLAVLEQRLPGARAINAAPCYLHVDQTAFLAEFLLPRMHRVDTVLTVLAPRDFETCPPEDTAFFDPETFGTYLSGVAPGWLPHVTGFRPFWLLREAWQLRQKRRLGDAGWVEDAYGSSVLSRPAAFFPEPNFDPRCPEGLTRLEAAAAASGARLVVATLPTAPRWSAAFDPDGALVDRWMETLRSSLRRADSVVIDGRALAWDDARFADPVHLLQPHHTLYTELLADALLRQDRRQDRAGPGES